MEILRIGEELNVAGYKSITLQADMSANIEAFAQANGITTNEAARILDSIPALRYFAQNLDSQDTEDFILSGDFVDDSKKTASGKKSSVKTAAPNMAAENAGAPKTAGETTFQPETYVHDGITFVATKKSANATLSISQKGKAYTVTATNYTIELTNVTNKDITVTTNGSNITLNSTAHVKSITNKAENSEINGSDEADTIVNEGKGSTINGKKGDDKITNKAENSHINGNEGVDTITNEKTATGSTIDGGSGTDKINNKANNVTINNIERKKEVTNASKLTGVTQNYTEQAFSVGPLTIKVKGTAADAEFDYTESTKTVKINGKNTKVPVITITAKNCTINLEATTDPNVQVVTNGERITLNSNVRVGQITNKAKYSTINGSDEDDVIINESSGYGVTINAGKGHDNITNKANAYYDSTTKTYHRVTINGNEGNDTITNSGSGAKINGGIGKDTITNSGKTFSKTVSKVKTELKVEIDGGSGNDKISNSGQATIDAKDGADEIEVTSTSADTIVNNFENGVDKVTYTKKGDETTLNYTTGHSLTGDVIGSLEYLQAALGITFGSDAEVERDNNGKVTKIYLDGNADRFYEITYGANGVLIATLKENDKVTSIKKFDSSKHLTEETTNTYAAGGYVQNKKTYNNGAVSSEIIKGISTNGTVNYTITNNHAGEYPRVTTTVNGATILFSETKSITVDGEATAVINADGSVTVTAKNGTITKYNAQGNLLAQGEETVGSPEYLKGLLGLAASVQLTGVNYNEAGKVVAFAYVASGVTNTCTVTYEANGNVKIHTVYSGGATPGNPKDFVYDSNGNNIRIVGYKADGTTIDFEEVRDFNAQNHLTKSTRTSHIENGRLVLVIDYDPATGNATKEELKGYTEGSENPSYTIVNNKPSNGTSYPQIEGGRTEGIIRFSATKSVTVYAGGSAVINADGTVVVTAPDGTEKRYFADGRLNAEPGSPEALQALDPAINPDDIEDPHTDGQGRLVSFNCNGKHYTITYNNNSTTIVSTVEDYSGRTTTETSVYGSSDNLTRREVKVEYQDGSYTETISENYSNGNPTKVTYTGHDVDGNVTYSVVNNHQGDSYPQIDTTTPGALTIRFSNTHVITISNGKTAVISANGVVEVTDTDRHITVYGPDGREYTSVEDAPDGSSNSDIIKNILGFFNLPANAEIQTEPAEIDSFRNITISFVYNGSTYRLTTDDKGVVTESEIVDASGRVTQGPSQIPLDEVRRITDDIEKYRNNLNELVNSLVIALCGVHKDYYSGVIRDIIERSIRDLENGVYVNDLLGDICSSIQAAGLDGTFVRDEVNIGTVNGRQISGLCATLEKLIGDKKAAIAEESVKTTTTEQISAEGINFNVTYEKEGSHAFRVTNKGNGEIEIYAENCTIDVAGLGISSKKIVLRGSNVTFNNNNLTFQSVTNYIENATINGSDGDDNIINHANGAIIKGQDGDDRITNYAEDATLKGEDGNDTLINYGASALLYGGNGTDAFNYVDGSARRPEDLVDGEINNSNLAPSDNNNTPAPAPTPEPTPEPGENPPSGERTYLHQRTYTNSETGVTYTIYYNSEDTVAPRVVDGRLVITANDAKVVINSMTNADAKISLQGSNVEFFAAENTALADFENYAANSVINGSNQADYITNFASGTTVNGNAGNDHLVNDSKMGQTNTGSTLNGGAGNDTLSVSQTGITSNTTVHGDAGDDTIYVNRNVSHTEVSGDEGTDRVSVATGATDTIVRADSAADRITDNGTNTQFEVCGYNPPPEPGDPLGGSDIPEDAEEQIEALRSNQYIRQIGLTTAQYDNFVNAQKDLGEALRLLKQISAIIEQLADQVTEATLSSIKMAMIDDVSETNKGLFDFNNEILADAQILVDAKANTSTPAEYNEYVKNAMIVDGSNKTIAQLFSETNVGDVAEKDGKLYVNDGNRMYELSGLTAETYLELFPPVTRFQVEQYEYSDCFFIAPTLIDFMENGLGRATLLKMFSEDANGNITITFPNVAFPVTFPYGELFNVDGAFNGNTGDVLKNVTSAKGLQMIEQAYALAKFSEISYAVISDLLDLDMVSLYYSEELADAISQVGNTNPNNVDIDAALTFYTDGGFSEDVFLDLIPDSPYTKEWVTNANYSIHESVNMLTSAYLNTIAANLRANKLNNNQYFVTVSILSIPSDIAAKYNIANDPNEQYNLVRGHQYSIEKIEDGYVYLKNPYDSYQTMKISYNDFMRLGLRINEATLPA